MFVAYDEKGNQINVAEKKWSRERLMKLREQSIFICPTCQNEVELRIGSIISAHFAHKKSSNCPTVKGSSETQYHMKGKLDLYNWLRKQESVDEIQLEPFLADIKQRPDLLIRYGPKKLVLEYQCSTINIKLLQKRSMMYEKAKLPFLWIAGGKSIKRSGGTVFHISPLQWHFILKRGNDRIMMYGYCTDLESFIVLQNIIPFSPRTVFADQKVYPIHSLSFSTLITPPSYKITFLQDWFNKVKAFRLYPLVFKTKQVSSLHLFLYQKKQIPLSFLPSYAFLPLTSNYLIESPVYVWQGWVILFIDRLPLNSRFTLKTVHDEIDRKVKHGLISVRSLPNINEHYSFALKEYLVKLSKFSVIKHIENQVFRKVTPIDWPSQIEELLAHDGEVMKKMIQKMILN